MKNLLIAIALAALVAPAGAADTYRFDRNHTRPMFEVSHMGFSTQHGRFGNVDGSVTLDAASREGSINFVVDTSSIDMGTEDWNRHMRSDEFFKADEFPTMSFRSEKLLFDGDRVVAAEGRLTLMGVTKPLRISVEHFHCAPNPMNKVPTCGADITAQIKRSDFGMTRFLSVVGDDVKIFVPVEATKM